MSHLYGITAKKINAFFKGKKRQVNISTYVTSTVYTESTAALHVKHTENKDCDSWSLDVKKELQYLNRRKDYFQYLYNTPKLFVEVYSSDEGIVEGSEVYLVPEILNGKKFSGVYNEDYDVDDLKSIGKLKKDGRSWVIV